LFAINPSNVAQRTHTDSELVDTQPIKVKLCKHKEWMNWQKSYLDWYRSGSKRTASVIDDSNE